jgi:hypothetical protein
MSDSRLATTVVGQIHNGFLARMATFSPAAIVVWLVLAARADEESVAWPSVDSIQSNTGMSRGAVCRALAELRTKGEIFVECGGGRYGPKKYRIRTSSDSELVPNLTPTSPNLGLAGNIPNQKQRTRNKKGASTTARRFNRPIAPSDHATAEWMVGLIRAVAPKFREPNLDRWANDIRLMRESDSLSDEEIRAVFRWANGDHFWQSNILSPQKLRDKFTTLLIQMKSGGVKRQRSMPCGTGQVHPDDVERL